VEWQIDEEELLQRNRQASRNRSNTMPGSTDRDLLSNFHYVSPQYRSTGGGRVTTQEKNQNTHSSASNSVGTSTTNSIVSVISATVSGKAQQQQQQQHQQHHTSAQHVVYSPGGTVGTANTTSSSANDMDLDLPQQSDKHHHQQPSLSGCHRVKPLLPVLTSAAGSRKPAPGGSGSRDNSGNNSAGSVSSGSRATASGDKLFGLSISTKKVFVGGADSNIEIRSKGSSAFSAVSWTGKAKS
jgi:hypothetical protein